MAQDVFGLNKNVYNSRYITRGSGVLISFNSKDVHLAQSCNINYQREVTPIYELGSEDIYAGSSNPAGTAEISKIISSHAFALELFKLNDGCSAINFEVGGGDSCGADFGIIKCPNSMLTSVGIQATAGQASVTENANLWIGTLQTK